MQRFSWFQSNNFVIPFRELQTSNLCVWKWREHEYLARVKRYLSRETKAIKNKVLFYCKILRYMQIHTHMENWKQWKRRFRYVKFTNQLSVTTEMAIHHQIFTSLRYIDLDDPPMMPYDVNHMFAVCSQCEGIEYIKTAPLKSRSIFRRLHISRPWRKRK